MKSKGIKSHPYLFFAILMCFGFHTIQAQDTTHVHNKKCKLKGEWQLISTFSLGQEHTIAKDEYDGKIRFRPLHRYEEEVNYESMHWIIKGKWKVDRHKATLLLTKRHYTLGELEKNPADIQFDLIQVDKQHWTGAGTANGAPVRVSYQKISRK